MRFWDSSAIVPLLLRQPSSEAVVPLLEADVRMAVWWGTPVECMSALARVERERTASQTDITAAAARLRALADEWHEIQPRAHLRTTAERLSRVHPLRSADALQLAAALEARGLPFVCYDRRLADAAAREGLVVVGLDGP